MITLEAQVNSARGHYERLCIIRDNTRELLDRMTENVNHAELELRTLERKQQLASIEAANKVPTMPNLDPCVRIHTKQDIENLRQWVKTTFPA